MEYVHYEILLVYEYVQLYFVYLIVSIIQSLYDQILCKCNKYNYFSKNILKHLCELLE